MAAYEEAHRPGAAPAGGGARRGPPSPEAGGSLHGGWVRGAGKVPRPPLELARSHFLPGARVAGPGRGCPGRAPSAA